MYVKFFKVASLPVSPVADALYFVENGQYAEAYVTDSAGVAKKLGNTSMIENIASVVDGGTF